MLSCKFELDISNAGSIILKIILVLVFGVPNPSNLPTVYPFTLLRYAIFTDVGANAVLLARFPFPDVFSPVSPDKGSLAFTFIVQKLTLVLFSVSPCQNSLSVHFVFGPVSRVRFSVWPIIIAVT